nr:cystin-1 isoform X2 [Chrysemys picta bellii]
MVKHTHTHSQRGYTQLVPSRGQILGIRSFQTADFLSVQLGGQVPWLLLLCSLAATTGPSPGGVSRFTSKERGGGREGRKGIRDQPLLPQQQPGCSEAAAAAGLWNPSQASHPVRRPRQHPAPGGSSGSMGSGSSRSRRKRSCSPGADRPGRWGRSSSAPSGQGEEAKGSQAPAPTELPSSSRRRPQPGGPAEDSDWELLEEVLAECEEPGALFPTARGPAAPIPGPPRRGPAGDSWAGHDRHPGAVATGSGRGSGAAGGDQPASLTRSTQDPENNNSSASENHCYPKITNEHLMSWVRKLRPAYHYRIHGSVRWVSLF